MTYELPKYIYKYKIIEYIKYSTKVLLKYKTT